MTRSAQDLNAEFLYSSQNQTFWDKSNLRKSLVHTWNASFAPHQGLMFNSKSIQTPLDRTYWIVPLILTGRDDTEPALNKADAILSVTQNTLQWIWRHPELHSCHFPAPQPSGRPAISYSKCKLLRLVLKETSISNCACKIWAPQKTHSGLCLEQTWRWSLPEAETSMGGAILGNTLTPNTRLASVFLE